MNIFIWSLYMYLLPLLSREPFIWSQDSQGCPHMNRGSTVWRLYEECFFGEQPLSTDWICLHQLCQLCLAGSQGKSWRRTWQGVRETFFLTLPVMETFMRRVMGQLLSWRSKVLLLRTGVKIMITGEAWINRTTIHLRKLVPLAEDRASLRKVSWFRFFTLWQKVKGVKMLLSCHL